MRLGAPSQCALAMQDAMVGYDAVATDVGTFRLEAKIGAAAGAVLSTTVGDPRHGWSTLSQDRPSTSARTPSITRRRGRSSRTPTS